MSISKIICGLKDIRNGGKPDISVIDGALYWLSIEQMYQKSPEQVAKIELEHEKFAEQVSLEKEKIVRKQQGILHRLRNSRLVIRLEEK